MVGTVGSDELSDAVAQMQRQRAGILREGESGYIGMVMQSRVIGIGESSTLGWFEVTELDLGAGTVAFAKLVRSLTEAERLFVLASDWQPMMCRARESHGDTILAIVLIEHPIVIH